MLWTPSDTVIQSLWDGCRDVFCRRVFRLGAKRERLQKKKKGKMEMKLITWNRKQPVLKSPCPLNNTPRNEHDRVRYFFDLTITSTMFFEFVAVWLCFNAQSVFFFIIFSMKRLRERQKEQGFVRVHIFRRSVWVWFFFFFLFLSRFLCVSCRRS